ncbi:MAG: hypothetical protein NT151_06775 [Acidobacteria bacterium]|nr:hypothetical protein [Acidobacteriota bacterium]
MRVRFGFLILVLGLAVTVGGCATPPTADIEAAKTAITNAGTAGAGEYAAASFTAAQDAQAALDAELKAQEGKSFKSFDKAKALAVAAKAAGEKATTDAAAGKEKAKADATLAIADAKTALTEAQALLDKAPKGKGSAADIAAMKTDLTTAATTISEAKAALGNVKYLDAKVKAESAKNAATTVKTAVEAAMAAKKK